MFIAFTMQIENKDEYSPNRHNIIFKEIIYSCDKVFSSLSIELKPKSEKQIKEKEKEKKENLIDTHYQPLDVIKEEDTDNEASNFLYSKKSTDIDFDRTKN